MKFINETSFDHNERKVKSEKKKCQSPYEAPNLLISNPTGRLPDASMMSPFSIACCKEPLLLILMAFDCCEDSIVPVIIITIIALSDIVLFLSLIDNL